MSIGRRWRLKECVERLDEEGAIKILKAIVPEATIGDDMQGVEITQDVQDSPHIIFDFPASGPAGRPLLPDRYVLKLSWP